MFSYNFIFPSLNNTFSSNNNQLFAIDDMYCQPINEITDQVVELWNMVPCPNVMGNMTTEAWSNLTTNIDLIGA